MPDSSTKILNVLFFIALNKSDGRKPVTLGRGLPPHHDDPDPKIDVGGIVSKIH